MAWQKAQGYDFIKVYDNLDEPTYQEIILAAREHNLPVAGHVPWQVGLEAVLASGQLSIEHLSGYIDPDTVDFLWLVDTGLSPYDTLAAGTRNAAAALGKPDEFGTVAQGKRADLILLEANPLEDVGNVGRRVGVMLRGRWLPEAQLQEMLTELKDFYRPSVADRLWPVAFFVPAVVWGLRGLTRGRRWQGQ